MLDETFVQGLIEDATWHPSPQVGDYEGTAYGYGIDLILHADHVAYRVISAEGTYYGKLTDREFIESMLLPLEYERRAKR